MMDNWVQPEQKQINIPDDFSKKGYHTLSYVQWGESSNQQTLFCVHGLTRNSRDFDYLAQSASKDYCVIAIDIAGRGKSEWLEDYSQYHYQLYALDMLYVMDTLGLNNVHWLGTSMGGVIGMMVASLRPEQIKKMVLNDIGAVILGKAIERIMEYVRKDIEFESLAELKQYMQSIFSGFGINTDEHWNHMVEHSHIPTDSEGFRLAYDPKIAQAIIDATNDIYEDMNLWELWHQVQQPVLIIRGDDSDILSKDVMQQMSERDHVEYKEIINVGHAPALMEPSQISTVLNWFSRDV